MVDELIQGKLYTQKTHRNNKSRTVMCVKIAPWRSYRQITLMIMGQPKRPLEEFWLDRFKFAGWLKDFSELIEEQDDTVNPA